MTRRYRFKPITVEARCINADDWEQVVDIAKWCNADIVDIDNFLAYDDNAVMAITTLEGVFYAGDGDWIVKGVMGDFYPLSGDVFDATYEPEDAT